MEKNRYTLFNAFKDLFKLSGNSKKQYILSVSSICYIVDDLTGEIQRYSFEDMDRYQTYEYFDNGNQYIIFLTENKNSQLSDSEIINSLIGLLE